MAAQGILAPLEGLERIYQPSGGLQFSGRYHQPVFTAEEVPGDSPRLD
jgi:hypothetical protein